MDSIFKQLFQYGFHDTEITSIDCKGLEVQKESFRISMCYYSNFNSCVLFDGGISKRNIMFSIEGINEIIIQEL